MEKVHKQLATKIGMNRGKPRVWLQGTVLTSAGFKRGDFFSLTIEAGRILIERNAEGDRTVSGKGEMPIVDIATPKLLDAAPAGTRFLIKNTKPGRLLLLLED